jgi:hypothetical protein
MIYSESKWLKRKITYGVHLRTEEEQKLDQGDHQRNRRHLAIESRVEKMASKHLSRVISSSRQDEEIFDTLHHQQERSGHTLGLLQVDGRIDERFPGSFLPQESSEFGEENWIRRIKQGRGCMHLIGAVQLS